MKLTIEEFYNYTMEFYGNNVNYDEITYQGEKLQELHKKTDDVYELTLSNGEVLLPSAGHIVIDSDGNNLKVKELITGTVLSNNIIVENIKKIKENVDVYDVSVDNGTSLYEMGGIIHHNTSSTKIRNVLRNILNGKIGDDKIPLGTYIIMASNFNDDGVDDIPENHDFNLMKYETPEKEDLFNYFYGKYVDNPEDNEDYDESNPATRSGIAIKPEVFNTFYEMVQPSDLGKNDENADVRLSPRRLEQMLIYVDSMTPCKNLEEVQSLLSYIKNGLSNYLDPENGTSEMVQPYMKIVKEIIKKTSDLDDTIIEESRPLGSTDWHKVLESQIESKLILGENKKYIPVVSGDPGIGKTSAAVSLAESKNMGFIQIDVSNRAPEDFTGMPNADMSGENITVEFTEPALYRLIMKDYNEQIQDHKVDGRPYNVILLFDEMNRTSPAVFNAMRKVLLEKEFSEDYKLPDDIMVMGAINPKGNGTSEFTTHTRDVLDIIPSAANFTDVMEYAKNTDGMKKINDELGFDLSGAISKGLSTLADDFHSTHSSMDEDAPELDPNEQSFWWTFNGQIVYISGREFTEAMHEIASQTKEDFLDMGWDVDKQFDEEQYDEFIEQSISSFAKYLGMGLNMVVKKMQVEDFVPMLQGRIVSDYRFKTIYKIIKDKKSKGEISLFRMLENSDFEPKVLGKAAVGPYIKYASPTQYTQDLEQIISYILKKNSDTTEALSKIIKIVNKLKKSLNALDGISFEYLNNTNFHIRHTITGMLENGALSFIDLLENDSLLQDIDTLTK